MTEPNEPAGVAEGSSAIRWLLLGGAVVLAGLVVALVLTSDADRPAEDEAALPEPRSPQVEPLIAPGTGDIGWTWVNPLPLAMPTWNDVAVASPHLVAFVGVTGQAARFAPDGLFLWDAATGETLRAVAWVSDREALVVGDAATARILRTDGPAEVVETGVGDDVDFHDALVDAAGRAWLVGDAGTLLRLDGREATPVDTASDEDLLGAFSAGDALYVVGTGGTLLRVSEGDRVEALPSGTTSTLRAVGGCSGGALYLAGDGGEIRRRTTDGRSRRLSHTLSETLTSIACDEGRVVAVGLRGGILLVSGMRSVVLPSGTDRALRSTATAPGAPTWIVGDGGRLLQLRTDHVRTLTAGPTSPLWDIGTIGGALVAVGEWGRIIREHEDGLREDDSPTDSALAALAPVGRGELLAVGDLGALVLLRHDGAQLLESPSDTSFRDVASDGGDVLAVGTGGALLRGTPGAFVESRVPDAGDLWAVDGTPNDALVVGDEGTVLRIGEGRTARVPCDDSLDFRAVVRTAAGAFAAGLGGVIVRIETGECVVERAAAEGQGALFGAGVGPRGRPMVVGEGGVALVRSAEGGWEPAGLSVGPSDLRSVARDDRNVYVVGQGGVVVRHVILDGT